MSARIHPTGTTIHDPSRSWKGYVLHGAPDGRTHLVDLEGNDVRTWNHVGFPSELIDPTLVGDKLGHVLVQLSSTAARGRFNGIFDNQTIGELDWDGNVVWQWGAQAAGGAARQNHDWQRLPNGNTLIIASVERVVKVLSDSVVPDQLVREIAPDGTVVWEWSAGDHLEEFGISPEGIDLIRRGVTAGIGGHGFLTINNLAVVGDNHWWDEGDARFHPENFVIDSREANFVAIVDRKTGKVVWRLGAVYEESGPLAALRILNPAVPRPVDQLAGQHDAHIIPKGLPGAGNLLVFDNQGASGFPAAALGIFAGSRVLEIDPVKKTIVWQYTGESSDRPVWTFHSSFISSARRLPNGNTLIDEGQNGRVFQVTREGEIVWEYINPHFGPTLIGLREVSANWVFRAQPVPYEWVPKGTPHGERAVIPPDISRFRIPVSP